MADPTLGDRLYRLIETLFRELDQESIHREVEALRVRHPGASRRELSAILTRKAALSAGSVGAGAGAAGGALGVLAMAPDIFNLVRVQSRLILSIAFLHDQRPHLRERFREVLATLAISTGASAGRQGARWLLRKGLEGEMARNLARKIGGRLVARKLPAALPLLGGVAGAGLNFLAVRATGHAAVTYYEQLRAREPKRITGPAIDLAPEPARASRPKGAPKKRAAAKRSAAKKGAKKKAPAKKAPVKKSATKKAPAKKASAKKSAKKAPAIVPPTHEPSS
ncbi:MAG TPA: hypothetical protein VMS56_07295 [Thermoanaerobaculia bacterium]|nr:hypothetical protein [Thermoanaerobaculia bacterium]